MPRRHCEPGVRSSTAYPSVIARSADWSRKFESAGLPLIGDDLKSQFGTTLVHHALVDVLSRNGVQLRNTYQIVSGGNMDFLNMQDPERVKSKQTSKVQGFGGAELPAGSVPPLELELRMCVEDSPSAAGNVLDAVRYMKFAMDRGMAGVVDPVASLLMKATPRPMSEPAALAQLRAMLDQ